MIYLPDLLAYVVRPTLMSLDDVDMGQWSVAAEQLLLGTALTESLIDGNMHLRQVQGPALSIWQIEPATHNDIWINWLRYRRHLEAAVRVIETEKVEALTYNLRYACAIARQVYRRASAPLPSAGNAGAMARYWKLHYNSSLGAGDPEVFKRLFHEHVIPLYN